MADTPLIAELVLRGAAIGALAATAVAFFRGGASLSVRVAGLLFCLSVIGYVVNSSPALRATGGMLIAPAWALSLAGGGYFWLFIYVLFEDRRITWLSLVPAAVLTVVGVVGVLTAPPVRNAVWILHNLIEIALSVHALYIIYRSWRGDLVEARRRLRGPFLGVVTLFTIVLAGIEIGESAGVQASWYSLAGAATLAIFCLAGNFIFLQTRDALFGAALPARAATHDPDPEPRFDAADRLAYEKLAQVMDKDEAWKAEGLTIGTLAENVGIPEHRLRRLINDHSGHRNFAAFVNARRIDAAKRRLADPAHARTTVAAIAFELGFGSLGPFNRAFKEATGKTPTEWRRETLEQTSSDTAKRD
jgi:AraC-like DNA-binding protein